MKIMKINLMKEKILKNYKIPVTWTMYAVVQVQAQDINDAIIKVEAGNIPAEEPLGRRGYLEDTFQVDNAGLAVFNKYEMHN